MIAIEQYNCSDFEKCTGIQIQKGYGKVLFTGKQDKINILF